ncbi:MAG TPA: peptidylprolyl isomerase [Gaiellaceae bacterium]
MTRHNLLPLLAVALLGAVLAAGCGSGKKSVGANDVAVVGDRSISKQEFQKLLDQACATTKSQGQKCPQAGTEQYTALRKQAMQYLVQRAEFEQKAGDLGLKITDADVEAQLLKIKAQYFGKGGKCDANCEKKYRDQIAKQRLTDEQVHADVRANVIQNKIYEKVTADVEVSDKEIEDYYKKNKQQYVQPASRDVRHILVKKKSLADQLHQRLLSGADFAALAKKYSEDPSSKTQGGKLTVSKGRQVPEFDKAAFSLKTREISEPIKTQYGWHIIQPLSAIKNERKTPLKEVRPAIRQQLVQQKKQDKMRKWVDETTKDFESKTSFQVGYALPATTGTTPATP